MRVYLSIELFDDNSEYNTEINIMKNDNKLFDRVSNWEFYVRRFKKPN